MFYKNARIFCSDFTFRNGAFEVVDGKFGAILPACVPEDAISWGVPEEEAVRAASYNPAKALGVQDKIGSIETGKLADFVITNADYSEKSVFIGGKQL